MENAKHDGATHELTTSDNTTHNEQDNKHNTSNSTIEEEGEEKEEGNPVRQEELPRLPSAKQILSSVSVSDDSNMPNLTSTLLPLDLSRAASPPVAGQQQGG